MKTDTEPSKTTASTDSLRLKQAFFDSAADLRATAQLFSYLNDVYFFIKDREGRFIAANSPQLEKMGCAREEQIVGKTDYDFFPKQMVENYLRDDAQVMESGRPLEKKVELVANPDGTVGWHTTSKVPILGKNGEVIGIMGFMRDLNKSVDKWSPYQQMAPVIDYIAQNYPQRFEIKILADLVELSLGQFEKKFRGVFGISPKRFITRYRVTRACHELSTTSKPITKISVEIGFYDHSHFSREFKNIMGVYPGEYRKRHQN